MAARHKGHYQMTTGQQGVGRHKLYSAQETKWNHAQVHEQPSPLAPHEHDDEAPTPGSGLHCRTLDTTMVATEWG